MPAMSNGSGSANAAAALQVSGLNVFYGASHALQGVDLTLDAGVLSVVGRNGMGKTTLCKAIMGLVPVASGSIRFRGRELVGQSPAAIARLGIGYVPQGRRLWRTLTVDEHLRMMGGGGSWTRERIYATFPRLAERKNNGGAQLSGGEQQMLAIGRALLLNPSLLVMDEPTEGLAPVIVSQVDDMLVRLGESGDVDVLVIEQNIGVATSVAEEVAIMVNGRVNRRVEAGLLASDRALQQQLLGVGRVSDDASDTAATQGSPSVSTTDATQGDSATRTRHDQNAPAMQSGVVYLSNPKVPNRWSLPVAPRLIEQSARTQSGPANVSVPGSAGSRSLDLPQAARGRSTVIVAGTLDTKGQELRFIATRLRQRGLAVQLVDLSTSGEHGGAEVPAHQVAAFHPRGSSGVFTSDRGQSVAGMTLAFERWIQHQSGILGIIGAGGSGGTAMISPAMRSLPFGVPKILISTVASGDVRQYVGASDMLMMHSVADVQGLNSITREVLGNGAEALAGMVVGRKDVTSTIDESLPAVGITMFGVTTACVQQLVKALEKDRDCLVFHATGIGGQSMESLIEKGRISSVLDMTTTEVCDLLMGGVFAASEDRFGAIIRRQLPYVGSCGALDMVNFAAPSTVPEQYQDRLFYEHNPQITLMRTTVEENAAMGRWIGERLNHMEGPVRFFLPHGGVSALDAPGASFHDPAADKALFDSLVQTVRQTSQRQLVHSTHHINDSAFVEQVLAEFNVLNGAARKSRQSTRRSSR